MAPDGDQRTGGGLSPSIDPLADGGGKYSLRDQCTRPARATPCGVAAPTRPTCSSSVPCMLLTAWRSSAAVTLHRGPGAKRLRDVQLAISAASCTSTIAARSQHGFVPGSRRVRCGPPMRASRHPPDSGASTICHQCVPCSRQHRDVPESIGSWTLADRRLIRKSRFVVPGHCHCASTIRGQFFLAA